jgi:hypothetical protein
MNILIFQIQFSQLLSYLFVDLKKKKNFFLFLISMIYMLLQTVLQ